MDDEALREAERRARETRDPEAVAEYARAVCRLRGHDWTPLGRGAEVRAVGTVVDSDLCVRCHDVRATVAAAPGRPVAPDVVSFAVEGTPGDRHRHALALAEARTARAFKVRTACGLEKPLNLPVLALARMGRQVSCRNCKKTMVASTAVESAIREAAPVIAKALLAAASTFDPWTGAS